MPDLMDFKNLLDQQAAKFREQKAEQEKQVKYEAIVMSELASDPRWKVLMAKIEVPLQQAINQIKICEQNLCRGAILDQLTYVKIKAELAVAVAKRQAFEFVLNSVNDALLIREGKTNEEKK